MTLVIIILTFAVLAFFSGRMKSLRAASGLGGIRYLHSLPHYYGWYVVWITLLPVIVFGLFWTMTEPWLLKYLTLSHFERLLPIAQTGITRDLIYTQITSAPAQNVSSTVYSDALKQSSLYYHQLISGRNTIFYTAALLLLTGCISFGLYQIAPGFKARNQVEKLVRFLLALSSTIAILTTLGIVLSVLFESVRFFTHIPVSDFLFGTHWSPQIAIREDQQGASGAFGVIPLFAGTLLITIIAMLVAAPVGIFSAIWLAEYAPEKVRTYVKPAMEILAGIPTVVYGFIAALTIAPAIRSIAESMGSESVSSESALAAGLVMGVMIIPFVSSLSDDVIRAVPQSLRDASLAMGATRSETVKKVILPAALPGIVGGLLLAISRAIGETMIVVMAAGLTANLTGNPLESVTTITVQIVTLLVGDQEFDSPKTLAAFALGLTLFIVTLILNIFALRIVKKYREQYE
ncbi:Phosphate transport system permease protein PstC [Vibrio aerogenes CECT 7868]|uniref:Phosphate transport system permease protein n=1 Tax=Vibrio aerogenes CECT 7868 TaxID=1216006 RepID=A0A1M5ZHI3_9VIBR|nr:phosphate ABC transporter permease subunit PstC [Vibrio aerogenes]SHI23604.1 Phosphate transport system permease protein PstC [Vibrio aerogenes CECT 7868]